MINLQLLDVVKESLPNFDGENSSDLIKAEKILKAQQKIDSDFSLNDIENFISFFKENGNKFNILFEDENLFSIFKGEYFNINSSHNRVFPNIMQITLEFRAFCEEPIKKYIQLNIQNNNWENLRIFYKNYFPVISPLTKEFLIDQISQKNKLVRSIIPEPNHYSYLLTHYKHGINPHFYALQSDIDSSYFSDEILDINNDISRHQKTVPLLKAFLGRILVALGHFDGYTEELRRILKKNSRIGADWIVEGAPFFPKNFEKDLEKTNEKITKSVIDFRSKIAKQRKKDNVLKWIATFIGYYTIPIALLVILLKINIYIFITVLILEIIIFFIANKKMEKQYERRFENNNISALEKFKKLGYKLQRVQLYVFLAVMCIAVIIGLIIAWKTVPIIGILLTIGLPFVIRKELKKYK